MKFAYLVFVPIFVLTDYGITYNREYSIIATTIKLIERNSSLVFLQTFDINAMAIVIFACIVLWLASIIAMTYSRKKSEDALLTANEAELRTQEFISKFSLPFAQPYDFDELINNALYELRDFTKTDRAIILEFQPDGSLLCTHEDIINKKTPKVLGQSLSYETMKPILDEADRTSCFYEKAAAKIFEKYPGTSLDEKSFCYIPLTIGGNRAGYLVFFTVFEQANWAEGEFRLATMAGSIIAGAYSRKKGEDALLAANHSELRTQEFISKFSVPFAQPYDFDELINNALYELRDFTDTDRAIILEFQPDGSLLCTHENRINNETPKVLGRSLSYETMKPILDEADRTSCFYEKAAAQIFKKYPGTSLNEKSFCYIPLTIGGNRAGYLVFFTVFEQANWAEGEFRLATMAGSIIAGAYSRKESEDALLAANEAELRTQEFISKFSVPFTQPYDFDELVDNALYELRDFTKTDRAVILELQSNNSFICSYENIINEKVTRILDKTFSYKDMKPVLDEADKTGCFYEKAALHYFEKYPTTNWGEKSFCYIPLMTEGERAGYLVFATIFEQANWTEGEFRLATMTGSILAGAFSMRKNENALKEATLKAQQSNIAKSQFLSNMSHEIRTPMNAILGMTQIANRTSDVGKLKKCIEIIESSSTQLLSIINDVLDISKIESGKLELRKTVFSLERLIIKSCSLISAKANDKNIQLHISTDNNLHLLYVGDDMRISQVLANLLSNAVKFTPEGGSITLTAGEMEQSDNKKAIVYISVEDTGIGMTDEQLSRVFNSFEQADGSISRQYGGTGLGLAITKSLVEIMDGIVDVESTYGKGSKFIVKLSINRASKEEDNVYNELRAQFTGMRILLISNKEKIISKFTALIERLNLYCDVSRNYIDAEKMIKRAYDMGKQYYAVFFDFNLHSGETIYNYQSSVEKLLEKDSIVFITEYGTWDSLTKDIKEYGVKRNLEMPLFSSSLYDMLVEIDNDTKTKNCSLTNMLPDSTMDFSGVSVLLAEDMEVNRIVFTSLLEDTGIQVDFAENGRIAVEMFKESPEKYDMIIMDVQMPGMNGLDATRKIRESSIPQAQTIPIIAVTANAFKEDADECLSAGMNDHLAKPIKLINLYKMFNKWLPENKRTLKNGTSKNLSKSTSEGLARFGGNKKKYENALLQFERLLPDEWPAFNIAVTSIEKTGRDIHTLKGVAGNLSEKEIYQCAVDFENSIRRSQPDENSYRLLVEACNKAKKRIIEQTSKADDTPLDTGTKDEFIKLLNELKTALRNYDLKACSNVTRSLKEKNWTFTDETMLQRMYELTQKYEFDDALDILNDLPDIN